MISRHASKRRLSVSLCLYGSLLILLSSLFIPGCSNEPATYPWRPITLVCPWSVGGGTDRVSRLFAFYLEHQLNTPVNVVNATGGRGVTGHARGLRSRPDGYTLTTMTVELNMLRHQGLTVISYEDAEPLYSINEDATAIFVPTDSPYQNITQLIDAIRANPGRINASGTASGGIWHMGLAGLLQSQGLSPDAANWISINSSEASLTEMDAGGVDLVACSLPEARSRLENGSIRCLVVMAEERVPGFEQYPTLNEMGIDWTMNVWRGIGVPKGTPQDRLDVLNNAIEQIVTGLVSINGTSFPEAMDAQGFNRPYKGPQEFATFLAETDAKFAELFASPAFATSAHSSIPRMAFPYAMFILIAICSAILLIRMLKRTQSAESIEHVQPGEDSAASVSAPALKGPGLLSMPLGAWVNVALIPVAVILYVVFAEAIGFLVIAAIIMLGLLLRFGARSLTAALTTLLLVPAVYLLFAMVLRVPLPPPPWLQ